MEVGIHSILIWVVAIIIASLGLVIYVGSKEYSSRVFVVCVVFVTMWITGVGLLLSVNDHQFALFIARANYYLGNLIAISFLYFFLVFPDNTKTSYRIRLLLLISQIILLYVFIFTDKIIENVEHVNYTAHWIWTYGELSYLFELIFIGSFTFGIIRLFSIYKKINNVFITNNLRMMMLIIIVGSIPPTLMCIILPRFGYFNLNWFGPITEIVWIPIIAYSIIKYRQMNVRAVIAEVVAVAMTLLFFINIFLNTQTNILTRSILFLVFIFLAIYLINISIQNARNNDELQLLNIRLHNLVDEKIIDVKKAYDSEQKTKRDLEKLNETKDQFIMLTQHNLRIPVNNIKSNLDTLSSNLDAVTHPTRRDLITNINYSVDRLIGIVNDYLSITTLKSGSQILKISTCSILDIIKSVINEFRIEIDKKCLTINFTNESIVWPEVQIDQQKIREVMLVIIENAIRYNIDGGTIDITHLADMNTITIKITNTGIGMSDDESQNVAKKLFYRGNLARQFNPTGMGIGLQIASAIVNGHKGRLSITSIGINSGASVDVVLPISHTEKN